MLLEITVLDFPLRAALTPLDEGLHVLLTGGCRTHVGAVTLAEPGCPPRTLLRQSHRDDVLSTRWAATLSDALHIPVCTACGVHYDDATPRPDPHHHRRLRRPAPARPGAPQGRIVPSNTNGLASAQTPGRLLPSEGVTR